MEYARDLVRHKTPQTSTTLLQWCKHYLRHLQRVGTQAEKPAVEWSPLATPGDAYKSQTEANAFLAALKDGKSTEKPKDATKARVKEPPGMCDICHKGRHFPTDCEDYQKATPDERKEYLMVAGRCFNCLKKGHNAANCHSTYTCALCNGKHHTTIHGAKRAISAIIKSYFSKMIDMAPEPDESPYVCHIAGRAMDKISLRTVPVKVINPTTRDEAIIYALLDDGSQTSLVSEDLVAFLGLRLYEDGAIRLALSAAGGARLDYHSPVTPLRIESMDKTFKDYISLHVIPTPTGDLKPVPWNEIKAQVGPPGRHRFQRSNPRPARSAHSTGIQLRNSSLFEERYQTHVRPRPHRKMRAARLDSSGTNQHNWQLQIKN